MRDLFLYKCFVVTKNSTYFHEWFRVMILQFQIPIIYLILKLMNGSKLFRIIPRHSLTEPFNFNLFMSDIDLTFITPEEESIPSLLRNFYLLKKVFINLGEPEVLTKSEFKSYTSIESKTLQSIWQQLFLIRKLHWQQKKLNTVNMYELAKINRGIIKCYMKLFSIGTELSLNNIFIMDFHSEVLAEDEFPYFSKYLEHWIEIGTKTKDNSIVCSDLFQASGFLQILPDHFEERSKSDHINLKRYIHLREICMSKCQLRILTSKGEDNISIREWIERLEYQFASI